MKNASKTFLLVLTSAALILSGCSKKPERPDPSATVLGSAGGENGSSSEFDNSLNPIDISTTADPYSQLASRDSSFDLDGQMRDVLQAVYFDFDSSSIKGTERAKLEEAAQYLRDNPNHRILLEGHCDWHGTAEYNLGLGDRRANAALKYLTSLGVSANSAETLSKGSLEAEKNVDKGAASKDRRVEVIVIQ
jgi:peptidoglycan-associated lipoprotein